MWREISVSAILLRCKISPISSFFFADAMKFFSSIRPLLHLTFVGWTNRKSFCNEQRQFISQFRDKNNKMVWNNVCFNVDFEFLNYSGFYVLSKWLSTIRDWINLDVGSELNRPWKYNYICFNSIHISYIDRNEIVIYTLRCNTRGCRGLCRNQLIVYQSTV